MDDARTSLEWKLLVLLMLFAPLVQGGAPRLPRAVIQIVILLLAASWVHEWGWRAPCRALRLTLLDALLGMFLFLALFSFLFAPYQHSAGTTLLSLLVYAVFYWWLCAHPSTAGIEALAGACVAQGLFQASLTWYQSLAMGLEQPAGTFYNPNFMAMYVAACAVLVFAPVVYPSRRAASGKVAEKALRSAAALLMAGAVVLSESRGGALALCAGAAVLISGRSLALSLGAVGSAAAALFVFPNPWADRILSVASADAFAFSRFAIWKSALEMLAANPWLGVGLGQFEYVAPRYAFPVESHWARYSRVAETAHCEYLQVGAELGVPGLLVCLSALAMIVFFTARKIRGTPVEDREVLVSTAAALAVVGTHAAVDFPLQLPPVALLLVLLAARLRFQGVEGPSWPLDFRLRKTYGAVLLVALLAGGFFVLRPVVGFWNFLGAIGAPKNLLREKWSLEQAPKKDVSLDESARYLQRAVKADPLNAAYHNALGSRYFQAYLRGEGGEEMRRRGLYHASYSAQLNPNHFRYPFSLGQAFESLARARGDQSLLREAREEYRKALALAPKNYSVHEKLGIIDGELGEDAEAEARLREVVRLEPVYMRGWYNLAVFLLSRGRVREAKAAILGGKAAAARRPELVESAWSGYERALIDFDPELFDNFLEKIKAEKEPASH